MILRAPIVIKNNSCGLRGITDLINVEKGKLYPIETKSHRALKDSDRLELAFYWRLLEPMRKGRPKPKGYVLLNTGEGVEVRLTRADFEELDSLIEQIREVKEYGTEPMICKECKFCRLQDECQLFVVETGGLTLVHGIAGIRQMQLESIGVKDIASLAEYDTGKLHQTWCEKIALDQGFEGCPWRCLWFDTYDHLSFCGPAPKKTMRSDSYLVSI